MAPEKPDEIYDPEGGSTGTIVVLKDKTGLRKINYDRTKRFPAALYVIFGQRGENDCVIACYINETGEEEFRALDDIPEAERLLLLYSQKNWKNLGLYFTDIANIIE